MGASRRNCCLIICNITLYGILLLHHPFVQASDQNQDSLNSLLYDYALKSIRKPRTGKLYDNVSLPYNLSGIEASIIRLRAHRLYNDGVNFSSIEIPPKILPRPFTRRVDIVYRNLGNRSKFYYDIVPNHTLVAPVVGFLVYDSTNHELIGIEEDEDDDDRIIVRFGSILFQESVGMMKCVRFDSNGTFGLSNVYEKSSCLMRGEGHFSIVVPYDEPNRDYVEKRVIKWWIIGLVLSGGFGLVLFIGVLVYKLVKWRNMKEMEKMSERSEGLDTVWIGNSKMFTASGIRTPPVLENNYVP